MRDEVDALGHCLEKLIQKANSDLHVFHADDRNAPVRRSDGRLSPINQSFTDRGTDGKGKTNIFKYKRRV